MQEKYNRIKEKLKKFSYEDKLKELDLLFHRLDLVDVWQKEQYEMYCILEALKNEITKGKEKQCKIKK